MKNFIRFTASLLAFAGVCAFFCVQSAESQVIQVTPVFPTADDTVTVVYDATKGTGGLKDASPVYMHTGVITNLSNNQWKYVVAPWGTDNPKIKMTSLGNNLHSLRFPVRSFYNVPASETIQQLAMVFRNVNGSREGKDDKGGDIFYTVYPAGSYNAKLLLPDQRNFFVQRGDTISIQFVASLPSTITLTDNGVQLSQAQQTTSFATFYGVTASEGTRTLRITAQSGTNIATDSITLTVRGAVRSAALPQGITRDGITYDSDSSAVFVLFAPNVPFCNLIGDFNNWQLTTPMNRTPDGQRFWVRVSGLTPRREYGFQYLVNGTTRTPDPYSEKILDPFNDGQVVSENRYPNLLPYPIGKTTGMVGILQTAQTPYVWKTQNFKRPAKGDMVVYELLIRDFSTRSTFKAAMDSLQYLKNLGVNCIELMPVMEFDGNLSWGYNPAFFCAVDKYYGTENDLRAYIDSAHALGMAVVLDMVLNHATGSCPLYQLYPASSNPYFNVTATHPYNVFNDFNHEFVGTQIFADNVNRFWIEKYKFDGYRFDLSKGFTQVVSTTDAAFAGRDTSRIRLLKRMADAVWRTDPTAYVILEHFAENDEEIELANYGMMLWANMHGAYTETVSGRNVGSSFANGYYGRRGWSVPHAITYMESHDEERIMYDALVSARTGTNYNAGDTATAIERLQMGAAFFFTIPGPKMIWQFSELGYDVSINANGGRVNNKPVRWEYAQDLRRKRLYDAYRELIRLKLTQPVFSTTSTVEIETFSSVKYIRLRHPSNNVVVVGNFSLFPREGTPNFPQTGVWTDFFSGSTLNVRDTAMTMMMRPGEFRIYSTTPFPAPPRGLITDVQERSTLLTPALSTAYPNPASNATEISFTLPQAARVRLTVHDNTGREIKTLAEGQLSAGEQRFVWLADTNAGVPVADGVYFYRITTDAASQTGKIVVLR
jgi:1,4-alpha-glucan branching enzyme